MIPNYSKLFIDPNIHYPILNAQLRFAEYIQQCRAIIQNTRLDLQNNAEKIIEANIPFEFLPKTTTEGKKVGVLLIHGLLDSPFTMRDIGEELQKEGLLVRSVLLPGQGTIPGALLNIDYQQWIDTVNYGVESLGKEVDRIFLVGYSTGGTLAIYHAALHPEKIAGVILLAPALKINCLFDFLANWPASLSKKWPRAAWFHLDDQETLDYAKYRSTPFNAAYQVYRIAEKAKKLTSIKCPLFCALAASDVTVLSHVSIHYFLKSQHAKNRMIIYSKNANAKKYDDKRIIVRSACYPDMNIRDFSHSTILIKPDNPHYGKNGDYAEASHIDKNPSTMYGEYYLPLMDFHNFLHKHKLARYEYQRISFNPDFAFLNEQIKQFINTI